MYSFGCFPRVWLLYADVSEPSIGSIFKGLKALEDGTDRGFRNVGIQQSEAGETPKRIHNTLSFSLFRILATLSGYVAYKNCYE